MKHIIRAKIFLIAFLIALPSLANAQDPTLDAIISNGQKAATVGVSVYSIGDKKQIYNFKASRSLSAASTTKIVTAVASLKALGSDFTYKTEFKTDWFAGGVAHNLYIKGVGDPSLVKERLLELGSEMAAKGVRHFTGDIIIDQSAFSLDPHAEGSSNARAYNALTSALAVNFNSFAVNATNTKGKVVVVTDPPIDYFQITSLVKRKGHNLGITRKKLPDGREAITVRGGVSRSIGKYANVLDPVRYGGETIRWALAESGITVAGKVKAGKDQGTFTLIESKSKPLPEILKDMNKWSNNFMAEMTLKTLALQTDGEPGTTRKGSDDLSDYLASLQIPIQEYNLVCGSGLAPENRLSPRALTAVLADAYDSQNVRTDFVETLPIAAVDGTLRHRLKSQGLAGNVRAKTGTLDDVSTLAGYIETKAHHILTFSILANGPRAGNGQFFTLQEQILNHLYENY